MVYCIRRPVKWPRITGSARYEQRVSTGCDKRDTGPMLKAMVYSMRRALKLPILAGYAGYEQLWGLLHTPTHAPVRADRQ